MIDGASVEQPRTRPYEPRFTDRLIYHVGFNYYNINPKNKFLSYFSYESITNCIDESSFNDTFCSKLAFLCANEIDSFPSMTLRLVY